MGKKRYFGFNIGSTMILMIFVILCLVSFATLSLISANADATLSSKIAARNKAYYEACNKAEESLAGLDQTLFDTYQTNLAEEDYYRMVGRNKSYVIPISDTQNLTVEIAILYPETQTGPFYRIQCWKVTGR